ncbi:hypothetical protein EZV62_004364 [Acer yangbiense]|uniref:Uncharacterized protein n=1 Tax=Acer yangbiense TaxID=1000413 RepID=A0A5C7IK15_9ROSI|nr:hypothetical protein EZV62_004364 [Acer yangbiense]
MQSYTLKGADIFEQIEALSTGFFLSHKGYRCLHPSGKIYILRHVIFNEIEFPYQSLFCTSSPSPSPDTFGIAIPLANLFQKFADTRVPSSTHQLSHSTSQPTVSEHNETPISNPAELSTEQKVDKVFGANNVAKIINSVYGQTPLTRWSMKRRLGCLRSPVYGCAGIISMLEEQLKQAENDLYNAKKELAIYIGELRAHIIKELRAPYHLGELLISLGASCSMSPRSFVLHITWELHDHII